MRISDWSSDVCSSDLTGTQIDISDDGTIKIAAVDGKAAEAAIARINALTKDVEVGTIYEGKVAKIMDFGAFVTIALGKEGLVHISKLADKPVERSEKHTSTLQSLMRISYAVFCLQK